MHAHEVARATEDFGMLKEGSSTSDILLNISDSDVALAMYRVACYLANDSSYLPRHLISSSQLLGYGGNTSILNILISSYGFSRKLAQDLQQNSISLSLKRNGSMLFHSNLVVTPEVESGKWYLNINGTGVVSWKSPAQLRRLRVRARDSTQCETWLNRISAETCLVSSLEIAFFLDLHIRSVLEIRYLLSHERSVLPRSHVGSIMIKDGDDDECLLYWCELNFETAFFQNVRSLFFFFF